MRFLPTDFRLDLHQANTADSYSDTTPCHGPHTEPFSQPVSQSVLDGVQGETLWGGESRARDHTHKREQKAGQAAVERTTGQQ